MADETVNARLPPEVIARLDALQARLAHHPLFQAARVSRSFVLRLAVLRGVDALEKEHGAELTEPAPKAKPVRKPRKK